MTKARGIYPAKRFWTPEEDAVLIRLYPDTPSDEIARQLGITVDRVYDRAALLGIKKSAEFLSSASSGRIKKASAASIANRFQPGHRTWNKGTKGLDIGGKQTRFQPGIRQGKAMRLWQPVGTERISKDGYLERKINEDRPFQRRWRGVHLLVWEAARGQIPDGYAVTFKDGDKQNVDIENLQLTSRADLMRRNCVHNYCPEIAQLAQLRGAITRQINRKEKP
jgi:hypothetical protein